MTKKDLINYVRSQKDRGFTLSLIEAAFESLPGVVKEEILTEMYVEQVHVGTIYRVTNQTTGSDFVFLTKGDMEDFFLAINPKLNKSYITPVINTKRAVYGYTIKKEKKVR